MISIPKALHQINYAAYTINSTQEFIFIFGAGDGNVNNEIIPFQTVNDSIFVFDIKNMTFLPCTIKCPMDGFADPIDAICITNQSNDELMVFGFVHQLYSKPEMKKVTECPVYLIKFIQNFMITEYIHIFSKSNHKRHFKINIDDLLVSTF